ncbi:7-cyano-7-deazaguanine reductase [Candidatus Kinetoplastibacterium blastocrithidii TCC012E]|uniref:7-cyano-7-deazaguanine reductase n=1 Tax=Candidatus Kinetoplastidibacterium blastocrithidiae TCC012E TaxID=1208922 RepID=M1LAX6_9PROT|nr:NADPH-dependent 7-cyano-7-deazaguanine reductase QueF [Candidatus Kinetoplastibacterium blastocrithidii]AFZ83896.1 7-cyano-7-deazaguanine reductase [Candidatus Kinetoplastibacterium blastocrithidii (ex Strigomonas culicis)]AGF49623.1 7-cyano-7-deazaguanine reductase [Candidatus Kinetoplastibacterium blastocrithidii TCC012E]
MGNVNPLGNNVKYSFKYDPNYLYAIPRQIVTRIPMYGLDIWNIYELSWLNNKGKPKIAIARIEIPADSINIIESKSIKLYLNSLNNSRFESVAEVKSILNKDISNALQCPIFIKIITPKNFHRLYIENISKDAICIDDIDVKIDTYEPSPELLKLSYNTEEKIVSETIISRMFRSRCPVTGQPDWANIKIKYTGMKISHSSILKYIISYRNHLGFHEHCIDKIFIDISKSCKPNYLSIYGNFTRRGGIDINPWRTSIIKEALPPGNCRAERQ